MFSWGTWSDSLALKNTSHFRSSGFGGASFTATYSSPLTSSASLMNHRSDIGCRIRARSLSRFLRTSSPSVEVGDLRDNKSALTLTEEAVWFDILNCRCLIDSPSSTRVDFSLGKIGL